LLLVLTPGNGDATGESTRQTTRNFATQYGTEVAINTNYFESLLNNGADNMGFAAAAGEVLSLFQRNQPGHTTAINFSSDNFAEVVEGIDNTGTLTATESLPYNAIQPFPRLYLSGVPLTEGSDLFRARTQIGLSRDGTQMILFASTSQMFGLRKTTGAFRYSTAK
jgi:hypothetical protein